MDTRIADAAPFLLTGNRGEYLKVVREGEKAMSQGERSFKFYPHVEVEGETTIVAVDETVITVGEKESRKMVGISTLQREEEGS